MYYILQSQSIIRVSGVASRVIGRMGQCEECMHLQEISKVKYYRELQGDEK